MRITRILFSNIFQIYKTYIIPIPNNTHFNIKDDENDYLTHMSHLHAINYYGDNITHIDNQKSQDISDEEYYYKGRSHTHYIHSIYGDII
jgi:hypothetical protein